MKNYVYILLLAFLGISACKKESYDPYKDVYEQFGKDTLIINKFIMDNDIPAVKDSSGLYYQIIEPGTGETPDNTTTSLIEVKYTARLLNGNIFDATTADSTVTFKYPGSLIGGWVLGLNKIKEGGKIRLLVPSVYGYGWQTLPGIPASSVLDFDIELIKVTK